MAHPSQWAREGRCCRRQVGLGKVLAPQPHKARPSGPRPPPTRARLGLPFSPGRGPDCGEGQNAAAGHARGPAAPSPTPHPVPGRGYVQHTLWLACGRTPYLRALVLEELGTPTDTGPRTHSGDKEAGRQEHSSDAPTPPPPHPSPARIKSRCRPQPDLQVWLTRRRQVELEPRGQGHARSHVVPRILPGGGDREVWCQLVKTRSDGAGAEAQSDWCPRRRRERRVGTQAPTAEPQLRAWGPPYLFQSVEGATTPGCVTELCSAVTWPPPSVCVPISL